MFKKNQKVKDHTLKNDVQYTYKGCDYAFTVLGPSSSKHIWGIWGHLVHLQMFQYSYATDLQRFSSIVKWPKLYQ